MISRARKHDGAHEGLGLGLANSTGVATIKLTDASSRLRTEFSLKNGDGGVDDAQTDARNDASGYKEREARRSGLQDGADNHDPAAVAYSPATT